MQWYFCPDLKNSGINLPDEETHHLRHVLRAREGDEVIFTDGKGSAATVRVSFPSAKQPRFELVSEIVLDEKPRGLHLAIAPTKNADRLEWLVEKACELGVTQLTPVICKYSERREVNLIRLQKLVIAAGKQSQRSYFLELNPVQSVTTFIQSVLTGSRWIAHCQETFPRLNFKSFITSDLPAIVLIGPEGDFSPQEIVYANEEGWIGLDLGKQRLRTETAGLAVCLSLLL